MRTILLFILLQIVCFQLMAQEEKEWNAIDFSKQEWQWEDNLSVISDTRNGSYFCFSNLQATTKENKKKGHFQPMYVYFNVDREEFALRPFAFQMDIKNENNNPTNYHYYVYEENKKGKLKQVKHKGNLNWGFVLQFEDRDGNDVTYSESYFQSSSNGDYYLSVNDGPLTAILSHRVTNRLTLVKGLDNTLEIKGGNTGDTELHKLTNIRNLTAIALMSGPATRLVAENVSGAYITNYGLAKPLFGAIEKAFQEENYKEVITISTGIITELNYESPELYYDRALAHYYLDFYVAALEDCTRGLTFDSLNEDFYLLRAFCKLEKNDETFVDDLKRGGPEGVAIYKELLWELENNASNQSNSKSKSVRKQNNKARDYKPLRKNPNFKLN
ncbi:MAG: hypothetical protein PHG42_08580 [Bacteroides sp.]|nr:hypothetical protein [Bacteroides sp.]